jgi:hypothetical protein
VGSAVALPFFGLYERMRQPGIGDRGEERLGKEPGKVFNRLNYWPWKGSRAQGINMRLTDFS